ncbi:hypothetical protein Q3O60_11870 [Alkalimonas collagenimarina]|uniref:Uncharacterized protein n=1 Tax=Alkalimonas collagenimarina TaxID=400390 RepID=A0ABT9H1W7_9GAMM|nr:hypothetical protein [Alkalimonas collagenimarina]MDP4536890.1 hypothetical protein [Alkalimonas collagenimarina]
MNTIDRKQYPELDRLLWDTQTRFLAEKDALDVYERRWPFVDKTKLTETERLLIQQLANRAGGFLPVRA